EPRTERSRSGSTGARTDTPAISVSRSGSSGRATSSGLLVPGWAGAPSKMYAKRRSSSASVPAAPYTSSGARWRAEKARRSSMPWTWSAWACVNSTASTDPTPAVTSCSRSSGGVSMSRRRPPDSISAAVRVRRSRGSADVHVRQPHPICGTPYDVPVPRNTSLTSHDLDLEEVGGPGDLPWQARRHHDAVARAGVSPFQDQVAHDGEHGVVAGHTIDHHRRHAPHQRELAVGRGLGGHRQDRHRSPERRDLAGGEPARRE